MSQQQLLRTDRQGIQGIGESVARSASVNKAVSRSDHEALATARPEQKKTLHIAECFRGHHESLYLIALQIRKTTYLARIARADASSAPGSKSGLCTLWHMHTHVCT